MDNYIFAGFPYGTTIQFPSRQRRGSGIFKDFAVLCDTENEQLFWGYWKDSNYCTSKILPTANCKILEGLLHRSNQVKLQ